LKVGGTYFFEELYPTLYQNIITRHILLHPTENRFRRQELKVALKIAGLELKKYLEIPKLEIFGFAIKQA